jgi:Sulfotransferase family
VSLPDVIVIGAPKAGSTALHAALAGHPQLHLSAVKEPKFFLCDQRPPPRQHGPGDAHSRREWIWRRDDYEALFADAPTGSLRGESTPLYLQDPAAHDRIARLAPDAKLIAIIRDPVDRAYSNWAHLWSDGLEPEADFLAACAAEEDRLARGWAPFWGYKRLGRYGEQLEHLFSVFPREQVHVLRYRELVDQPVATLDTICAFLGVEPGRVDSVAPENVSTFVADTPVNRALRGAVRAGAAAGAWVPPGVWRRASKPLLWALKRTPANRPELTEGQRTELIAEVIDDIERLEDLLGQSFTDWKGHRVGGTYSVRKS